MKLLDIPGALAARFEELPPILSIPQLAAFFKKKTPTVRKQIDRGTFPVTVRQIEGGEQYVLLADLMRFSADGIPQLQVPLVKREARNPFGRLGKRGRGRPSHKEVAARNAIQSTALMSPQMNRNLKNDEVACHE